MRYFWLALVLLYAPLHVAAQEGSAQSILNLLEYVAVEYPEFVQAGTVVDAGEYAEQVEFAGQIEQRILALPSHPDRAGLARRAQALSYAVLHKRDSKEIVAIAREIQHGLVAAYNIPVIPRAAPDLSGAPALYAAQCALCHGAQGAGDGPGASATGPRPTNFQDTRRAGARSVFGLFNTITLGVAGTGMPSFAQLSAPERWALAFHVSQFSVTDAQRSAGRRAWTAGAGRSEFASLGAVVMTTPASAQAQGLEQVLAYLRSDPLAADAGKPTPIAFGIVMLERSRTAWRAGRFDEAYRLAVSAYLEGLELAELAIDDADRGLRTQTEQAMMSYRRALQSGAPPAEVEVAFEAAIGKMREAQRATEGRAVSPVGNFVSALVIILREGLEAILVLAAMGAFLIRSGRREGLPWLHGGWIAALVLGVLTWFVSSTLIAISGAQREVTEGITALISAAVLLYVGFWLHSKSSAVRWSAYLSQRMSSALGGGTWFGVGLVAFLAVYREVFETVLFYQTLWLQSGPAARVAVLGGLATGVLGLAVLGLLIIRLSLRLPLGVFFGVSGALLAVMAVVFAGQGVAALQAAGRLPIYPVSIPSIPLLGIYPSLQGLVLQFLLVTVIISGFVYLRAHTRNA